jgi:hypothetical protein
MMHRGDFVLFLPVCSRADCGKPELDQVLYLFAHRVTPPYVSIPDNRADTDITRTDFGAFMGNLWPH